MSLNVQLITVLSSQLPPLSSKAVVPYLQLQFDSTYKVLNSVYNTVLENYIQISIRVSNARCGDASNPLMHPSCRSAVQDQRSIIRSSELEAVTWFQQTRFALSPRNVVTLADASPTRTSLCMNDRVSAVRTRPGPLRLSEFTHHARGLPSIAIQRRFKNLRIEFLAT